LDTNPEIAKKALKKHHIAAVHAGCIMAHHKTWLLGMNSSISRVFPLSLMLLCFWKSTGCKKKATVVFSLHATKPLGAGEGGFVISRLIFIELKKFGN